MPGSKSEIHVARDASKSDAKKSPSKAKRKQPKPTASAPVKRTPLGHDTLNKERQGGEKFAYDHIRKTRPDHLIVDIGGASNRHAGLKRTNIHSCQPVTCPADFLRNKSRDPDHSCLHRIEECDCFTHTPDVVYMSIHSLYYLSWGVIAKLVRDGNELYALVHDFPEDKGTLADGEATYERDGDHVVMRARGDNHAYSHPCLDDLFHKGYREVNNRTLLFEPIKKMRNTTLFVITSVDKSFDEPALNLSESMQDSSHYGEPKIPPTDGYEMMTLTVENFLLKSFSLGRLIQFGRGTNRIVVSKSDFLRAKNMAVGTDRETAFTNILSYCKRLLKDSLTMDSNAHTLAVIVSIVGLDEERRMSQVFHDAVKPDTSVLGMVKAFFHKVILPMFGNVAAYVSSKDKFWKKVSNILNKIKEDIADLIVKLTKPTVTDTHNVDIAEQEFLASDGEPSDDEDDQSVIEIFTKLITRTMALVVEFGNRFEVDVGDLFAYGSTLEEKLKRSAFLGFFQGHDGSDTSELIITPGCESSGTIEETPLKEGEEVEIGDYDYRESAGKLFRGGPIGNSSPVSFSGSQENELLAIHNRVLVDRPPPTSGAVNELSAGLQSLAEAFLMLYPLGVPVTPFEMWVSRFPTNKRMMYTRAKKRLDDDPDYINSAVIQIRSMFIKREATKDSTKIPRGIFPTKPEVQVALGPFMHALTNILGEIMDGTEFGGFRILLATGKTTCQLTEQFLRAVAAGHDFIMVCGDDLVVMHAGHLYAFDMARWDGSVDAQLLFAKIRFYQKIGLGKVKSRLMRQMIKRVIFTSTNVKCVTKGKVGSGDPDTFIGNSLLVGVVGSLCMGMISNYTYGDDFVTEFAKDMLEFGLKITGHYCGHSNDPDGTFPNVDFCSQRLLPCRIQADSLIETWSFTPNLGRHLSKLGISQSKHETTEDMLVSKALSFRGYFTHVPFMAEIYEYILQDYDASMLSKQEKKRLKKIRSQEWKMQPSIFQEPSPERLQDALMVAYPCLARPGAIDEIVKRFTTHLYSYGDCRVVLDLIECE